MKNHLFMRCTTAQIYFRSKCRFLLLGYGMRHLFVSVTESNRCSYRNLMLNDGDSGENNHCEVEYVPPYVLANDTLQCVARGDPLLSACGEYFGRAVCEPSSGMSLELPNATGEQRKVVFGSCGIVTYHCDMGHLTDSGLAQFNISCQADGTFTNASSCLSVVCRKLPQISFSRTSFPMNASLVYLEWLVTHVILASRTSDYSTEFDLWCTEQGPSLPSTVMW